jgi:uroporphyrinogen-III decarboxylase
VISASVDWSVDADDAEMQVRPVTRLCGRVRPFASPAADPGDSRPSRKPLA